MQCRLGQQEAGNEGPATTQHSWHGLHLHCSAALAIQIAAITSNGRGQRGQPHRAGPGTQPELDLLRALGCCQPPWLHHRTCRLPVGCLIARRGPASPPAAPPERSAAAALMKRAPPLPLLACLQDGNELKFKVRNWVHCAAVACSRRQHCRQPGGGREPSSHGSRARCRSPPALHCPLCRSARRRPSRRSSTPTAARYAAGGLLQQLEHTHMRRRGGAWRRSRLTQPRCHVLIARSAWSRS